MSTKCLVITATIRKNASSLRAKSSLIFLRLALDQKDLVTAQVPIVARCSAPSCQSQLFNSSHRRTTELLVKCPSLPTHPLWSCLRFRCDLVPKLFLSVDSKVRHSSTSLARTVIKFRVSIATLLSKCIVISLKADALRSSGSTNVLMAATSTWRPL